MSQQLKDVRSLPHFIAQMIGEMNVRIERLERRTEYQGKAIKHLVSQNQSLRATITRANKAPKPKAVKTIATVRKPPQPTSEPAMDDYEGIPDFTAPLDELRRSH